MFARWGDKGLLRCKGRFALYRGRVQPARASNFGQERLSRAIGKVESVIMTIEDGSHLCCRNHNAVLILRDLEGRRRGLRKQNKTRALYRLLASRSEPESHSQ